MKIAVDSFGNILPKVSLLPSRATLDDVARSLSILTFHIAIDIALENDYIVCYDKETQAATLTNNEQTYIVNHN